MKILLKAAYLLIVFALLVAAHPAQPRPDRQGTSHQATPASPAQAPR